MAKPTEEETKAAEAKKAADEKAAAEAEAEESEGDDDFDKDRAMATIDKLRGIEKDYKAMKRAQAKADEDAAEAEKDLETKLADRDKRIEELESEKAEKVIEANFVTKAVERGYADPALAFLAAKNAGVLGSTDPKTGEVGDHDFEKLEETFSSFAGEAKEETGFGSGDAGVRGKKGKKTPASGFNGAIRGTIQGLDT